MSPHKNHNERYRQTTLNRTHPFPAWGTYCVLSPNTRGARAVRRQGENRGDCRTESFRAHEERGQGKMVTRYKRGWYLSWSINIVPRAPKMRGWWPADGNVFNLPNVSHPNTCRTPLPPRTYPTLSSILQNERDARSLPRAEIVGFVYLRAPFADAKPHRRRRSQIVLVPLFIIPATLVCCPEVGTGRWWVESNVPSTDPYPT